MFWHKLTTSSPPYPSENKTLGLQQAFTFINRYDHVGRSSAPPTSSCATGVAQFYDRAMPRRRGSPCRDLVYMNRISRMEHLVRIVPRWRIIKPAPPSFPPGPGGGGRCWSIPVPRLWSRARNTCTTSATCPWPAAKILITNGYDFNCINNNLLLNHAKVENGKSSSSTATITPVLSCPAPYCLARKLWKKSQLRRQGGGEILAATSIRKSPGMADHEKRRHAELRALCADL